MPDHPSIEDMVSFYCKWAVDLGREYNAELDYGENSLMEVESILGTLSRDMPVSKPSDDHVTELCKMFGFYLGEVVRRRYGGEWSIETYPGREFATLALTVNGNKLFPSIKVQRRLTEGEADNVWEFYRMVKEKLEKTTTTE